MKIFILMLVLTGLVACNSNTSPEIQTAINCGIIDLDHNETGDLNFNNVNYTGTSICTAGNCGENFRLNLSFAFIQASVDDNIDSTGYSTNGSILIYDAGDFNLSGQYIKTNKTVMRLEMQFSPPNNAYCQTQTGTDADWEGIYLNDGIIDYDNSCNVKITGTYQEIIKCHDGTDFVLSSGTWSVNN